MPTTATVVPTALPGSTSCWSDKASPTLLARSGCTAFREFSASPFKPVSFWNCHRRNATLAAIVVEVNNTFGERHCYLLDYRDIADAPFDAIVSIEMFEAVGREYWPVFFEAIRRRLRPGGKACIQSITINDDLFDRYVRSTDFIQQYIFPGGLLPSRTEFRAAAAAAGLRVTGEFDFGLDYAETLRRWRARSFRAEPAVRALGFDSRFVRIWEFYLAYCEAAFAAGNTSVVQFTLQRS